MSAVMIHKSNFQEEVLNAEKTVLLDFWAPWCGPCRMVGPVVDEIAIERELAMQFAVMSIPTLVGVKNGEVVQKTVGARPKTQILAVL